MGARGSDSLEIVKFQEDDVNDQAALIPHKQQVSYLVLSVLL